MPVVPTVPTSTPSGALTGIPWTVPGQFGPEELCGSDGRPLLGMTAAVPVGYVVDPGQLAIGNLLLVGPPAQHVTVQITPQNGTPYALTVPVAPSWDDLATILENLMTYTPPVAAVGARATNVVTKSAAYTAANNDYVLATTTSAFTVTSPAAAAKAVVSIKKVSADANAVTFSPATGTVDGATSYVLPAVQYASADFICDGTNWYIA